jgi:hypothetical protein
MVFPQLHVGPRKIVDMALKISSIVLFHHIGAERGIDLGVAWADVEHDVLPIS